jgi:hypothetical protein
MVKSIQQPMKIYLILFSVFLTACISQPAESIRLLESKVDSLEKINARAYTPDFGEFMIDIQIHHSKLWLAGSNKNWPLADYQAKKIKETISDLVKYQSERKEIAILGMLDRSVDSVRVAIAKKDPAKFIITYDYVTNTCNICHRSYDVGFNVIRTPGSSPFTNQDFHPLE